ncbi:hypothetical protein CDCA_CDCA03G0840 [Cyanidium caldarium]|uniref:4-hydroxybenzoate polyprenyltransferase, mitochondrial n=1 Tax=Cyanidium caldarium TaxID=2771 RepID=A0AAV9IR81_CYACA|nr:hypothetical protein CDCA_CDCA03G0840 [Cyanidium caldarium]
MPWQTHWQAWRARIRPYAQLSRWERPIGTWLLLWPGAWSVAWVGGGGSVSRPPSPVDDNVSPPPRSTSSTPFGDLGLQAAFAIGSVLLRGAGCTVNDLWDRDIDRRTDRTRTRPLASGALSVRQGQRWALWQCVAAAPVLAYISCAPSSSAPDAHRVSAHRSATDAVSLQWPTVYIGIASLIPLTVYPLAKRFTMWPQAVLGLTFNWGVWLGWSAASPGGRVYLPEALPLYAAGWCWTMVYDTIYAHQDKRTDRLIKVGSTALLFGDARTRPWLIGFTGLFAACLTTAGVHAQQPWPYYAGVAGATAHLVWQIATVRLNEPADCMRKFISNQWTGALLFAGIVAANAWRQRSTSMRASEQEPRDEKSSAATSVIG